MSLEHHPLTRKVSQPHPSPCKLLAGQASHIAILLLVFGLSSSWHPAGESWLSSHHSSLFHHMLLSYRLCSILFTRRGELILACPLRHDIECPSEVPIELRVDLGTGQAQHFKWERGSAQFKSRLSTGSLWETKKFHCLTSISIAVMVLGQFIPVSCTTSAIVRFFLASFSQQLLSIPHLFPYCYFPFTLDCGFISYKCQKFSNPSAHALIPSTFLIILMVVNCLGLSSCHFRELSPGPTCTFGTIFFRLFKSLNNQIHPLLPDRFPVLLYMS